MSESAGGGGGPLDDVKFFLLILLGLGILWYANGGYDRARQNTANTPPEQGAQEINVTVTTSTPSPTESLSPTPDQTDVYIIR